MIKQLSIVLVSTIFLSACTLPQFKNQDQGALQITTNLAAEVYLDEAHVGQTPFFNDKLKTGTYTLKLAPGGSGDEHSWQFIISINKGVLTVVNYEFGREPEASGYEILQLEALADKESREMTISTLPDNVIIKLDGELKGFSPVSFTDISDGDHTVGLEAPGYKTKTINAKVSLGHRLNISVQLVRDLLSADESTTSAKPADPEPISSDSDLQTPSPSPSASPTTSLASPSPAPTPTSGIISGAADASGLTPPYVKILEASAGIDWLRVRSAPSGLSDNEIAKVKVGTFFPVVDRNDSGWTQIEYQSGASGWVSSRYTQLTQ